MGKLLTRYVTVGGDTYPPNTDVSSLPDDVQDELKDHPTAFGAVVEPDVSVGAGLYDGREWTVKKLQAEVDSRNEDRDESTQIEVPEPGNKAELVSALELDDENHPA